MWSVVPVKPSDLHAQTQKIRISLSSRSNTNATYYVAQAKGIFKDEGLEVEFIQINPRLGALAVPNDVVNEHFPRYRAGAAHEDGIYSAEERHVLFNGSA